MPRGQSLTFAGSTTFSLSGGLTTTGIATVVFSDAINCSGGTGLISVTATQAITVSDALTGGTAGVSLIGEGMAAIDSVGVTISATITATASGPVTVSGTGGAGSSCG